MKNNLNTDNTDSIEKFLNKIVRHQITAAVIGLGYVGLPLAVRLASAGINTIGLDTDSVKLTKLTKGENYIADVDDQQLEQVIAEQSLSLTADYQNILDCEIVLICVPTPLDKNKGPDLSFVKSVAENLAGLDCFSESSLKIPRLVILESTTYPGTTREVLLPILSGEGRRQLGKNLFLAFSPERVDPGNKKFKTHNTPKIVGGMTEACGRLSEAFYQQVVNQVQLVSCPEAAEMSKLLENTFRHVNIALVNELALLCERMNIDVWEVIEAARSKPYGFMPFYPGPGLGGHCIPIDPNYLSWKARQYDFHTWFIEMASEINEKMPYHILDLLADGLGLIQRPLFKARILILGVAYKKDISDTRESPALKLIQLLTRYQTETSYHDPFVPQIKLSSTEMNSIELTAETLKKFDAVVISCDHSNIDYSLVVENSNLVVDTRNITGQSDFSSAKIKDKGKSKGARIVKLGSPFPQF